MRDNNIGLLRGVLRLTFIADTAFTSTAAIIQPITGAALWHMIINNRTHPWLWSVIGLYIGVGVCWLPVVWLQIRLHDAAMASSSIANLQPSFHRDFKR